MLGTAIYESFTGKTLTVIIESNNQAKFKASLHGNKVITHKRMLDELPSAYGVSTFKFDNELYHFVKWKVADKKVA